MKSPLRTFFSSFFSTESDKPQAHKSWSLIGFALIGLVAGLYYFHIMEQQNYLTKRNFRVLELWNEELTNKIQSFESVFTFSSQGGLPQLVDPLPDDIPDNIGIFQTKPKHENNRDKVAQLVSETKTPNTQMKPSRKWANKPACFDYADQEEEYKLSSFFLAYRHLCNTGLTNISLSLISRDPTKPPEELLIHAPKQDHDATFPLRYTKSFSSLDTESLLVTADLDLEEFLQNLANESVFDDVLIFDSTGKIIHQKSKMTFNWNNWGQLWQHTNPRSSSVLSSFFNSEPTKNEDSPDENSAYTTDSDHNKLVNVTPLPTSFTISVSDTNYEVFAQSSDHLSDSGEFLVICGIVSSDRFRQEILAVSSTALLIIMTTLGILVLSLPLLRLKMIGPTDPLRLSHTFMLVFSSFLGAGVLTFLFLDIVIYAGIKEKINAQLEYAAGSIRDSMHEELTQVLNTLQSYDKSTHLTKQVTYLAPDSLHNAVLLEEGLNDPCKRGDGGATIPDCYPDYLTAFWTDENGKLRINWTTKNEQRKVKVWKGTIDNVSLLKRQYVNRVLNPKNTLWQLKLNGLDTPFFLQPITSWTTGLNSVVASMPSQKVGERKEILEVAAMEFRFRSLMKDLVLPPQTGFAIIRNDDYQVLFHSTKTKNLRENFWAETDDDRLLRDLVFARTPGQFDGKYWGEDTHFYVMPISPMPWSIVVYQKREMLRSVNFVVLLISGGLFGAYAIIVLVGAGLLMGLFQWEKHRKAEWLWPRIDHDQKYSEITTYNILCFLGGLVLALLFNTSPGLLMLTGLLYSPLALGMLLGFPNFIIQNIQKYSHLKLLARKIEAFLEHMRRRISKLTQRIQHSFKISFPASYTCMLTSFLILGAVLPAFFIFKAVFFQETNLVVKHQLMDLYQDSRPLNLSIAPDNTSTLGSSELQTRSLLQCTTDKQNIESNEDRGPKKNRPLPFGMYPNAFIQTNWCVFSPDKLHQSTDPTLFDSFYRVISQPFVPLRKGIREWGFLRKQYTANKNASSSSRQVEEDAQSRSCRVLPCIEQKNSEIILIAPLQYRRESTSSTAAYLRLSADPPLHPWILLSGLPAPSLKDIPLSLLMLVFFTGYVTTLYKVPRFIANEVLFLSYTTPIMGTFTPHLLENGHDNIPNLIILGYPGQGKTSLFCSEKTKTLDLQHTPSKQWTDQFQRSIGKDVIVLDHFEWQSAEPLMTQAKLRLLEKLLGWNCDLKTSDKQTTQEIALNTSRLIMELKTNQKERSS